MSQSIGGLGIGIVCLSLAYATGGSPLRRMVDLGLSSVWSCNATGATATERRLNLDCGDTVNIAGYAIVHYCAGRATD